MRTFVTVFCMIFLLAGFILGERIFVDGFCRNFTHDIKNLESSVTRGGDGQKYIDKMVRDWEKQKNNIFVFANHNNFKEIETGIYNLEYSINSKKYSDAVFYTNALYHRVEELWESTKFTAGNLL